MWCNVTPALCEEIALSSVTADIEFPQRCLPIFRVVIVFPGDFSQTVLMFAQLIQQNNEATTCTYYLDVLQYYAYFYIILHRFFKNNLKLVIFLLYFVSPG